MATNCCSTSYGSVMQEEKAFKPVSIHNTLAFDVGACINCGMCSTVCPHGVFAPGETKVRIVRADACMECGACQLNCPTEALWVDTGVGCAAAMIVAALTGQEEPSCGGPEPNCC